MKIAGAPISRVKNAVRRIRVVVENFNSNRIEPVSQEREGNGAVGQSLHHRHLRLVAKKIWHRQLAPTGVGSGAVEGADAKVIQRKIRLKLIGVYQIGKPFFPNGNSGVVW